MKMPPGFQRNRRKKHIFAASSLLLLVATQTIAQSGRRAPKPTQAPVTTTDSEVTPKEGARELKQQASLVLGQLVSSKHLLSEDAIYGHFLKQLNEFKNVTTTSLGQVKRDAAIKYAKGET